jgi:cell division transport system permease protein
MAKRKDQSTRARPASQQKKPEMRKSAPIMPASGVAGRPLLIAITVMCYFASVTIGAVALVTHIVDSWTSQISSQVTVQIKPVSAIKQDDQIKQALALLKASKGVVSATAQSPEEARRMLEPWLGAGNVLDDLPIPRLIKVSIDRKAPPDLAALDKKLRTKIDGAMLDDHSQWQSELTRTATAIRMAALSILILVILTTISIVIFATRAAMAGNRDIVEVLHMIGARQGYIARQFQIHFLLLGIKAGIIGVILGAATFLAFNFTLGAASGNDIFNAANNALIGPLALPPQGFAYLLSVPPIAAFISVLTSRYSVLRFLSAMI